MASDRELAGAYEALGRRHHLVVRFLRWPAGAVPAADYEFGSRHWFRVLLPAVSEMPSARMAPVLLFEVVCGLWLVFG